MADVATAGHITVEIDAPLNIGSVTKDVTSMVYSLLPVVVTFACLGMLLRYLKVSGKW